MAAQAPMAHYHEVAHAAPGSSAGATPAAPALFTHLTDPAAQPSGAPLAAPPAGVDPFRGLGKVAALGIKISQHRAYHGVALNVAMDLSPFGRINPCGYAGLRTVDVLTVPVQQWVPGVYVLRLEGAMRRHVRFVVMR